MFIDEKLLHIKALCKLVGKGIMKTHSPKLKLGEGIYL